MSAPIPFLSTPTPDSRKRFVRAAWAAGFTWGTNPPSDAEARRARVNACFSHVYLSGNGRWFTFFEGVWGRDTILRQGTLVNSPAHWIAYARRHFPSKS